MIDFNKSYEENINSVDNKAYSRFVDQVIATGTIDTKYRTLLDTQDICNIVLLSIVSLKDATNSFKDNEYKPPKTCKCKIRHNKLYRLCAYCGNKASISSISYNEELNHIGRFFNLLNFELRERILRSLGLEWIVCMGLDEIDEFKSTFRELNKRAYGPKPVVKKCTTPTST